MPGIDATAFRAGDLFVWLPRVEPVAKANPGEALGSTRRRGSPQYSAVKSGLLLPFLFSVSLGLSCAGRLNAAAPAELSHYNVVWDTPGQNAAGSMPIGNGEMGLNLWVEEDGALLFYVSRTDAWSEICRLLKLGRISH